MPNNNPVGLTVCHMLRGFLFVCPDGTSHFLKGRFHDGEGVTRTAVENPW